MSNPHARPDDVRPLVGPLATVAHLGERVAQGLGDMGWDGLSEKAHKNLMLTGFTTIGCGASLLIVVLILVANATGLKGNDEMVVAPPPVVDPLALAPGETLYRVEGGDTLSVIAVKNGTTVKAIQARNPKLKDWEERCRANATLKPNACKDVVIKGGYLVITASAENTTASATSTSTATTQAKH